MSRSLWMPKRREMPEQCASCPFRQTDKDTDEAFRAVLSKLAAKAGQDDEITDVEVDIARFRIRKEVAVRGDFSCHQSVYTTDMLVRDEAEHRQCPGASAHYKATDPLLKRRKP